MCDLDVYGFSIGVGMTIFSFSDHPLPAEVCTRAKKVAKKFEVDLAKWSPDVSCTTSINHLGGGSAPFSSVDDPDCNKTWKLSKKYKLNELGNTWECDSSITNSTPTDGRVPLNTTVEKHTTCQIVGYGIIFTSDYD